MILSINEISLIIPMNSAKSEQDNSLRLNVRCWNLTKFVYSNVMYGLFPAEEGFRITLLRLLFSALKVIVFFLNGTIIINILTYFLYCLDISQIHII